MYHSFDTHDLVKCFIGGGIKEKQAELMVRAIAESRDYDLSNLATKSDIKEIKAEIKYLRAENSTETGKVRTELSGENLELRGEIRAIKTDLSAEIQEVRGEFKTVRSEFRAEIEKCKNEMIRWYIAMNIATASAIITALKFLL